MMICFVVFAVLEILAAVFTKSNYGSARALWITLVVFDVAMASLLYLRRQREAILTACIGFDMILIIPFSLITKGMFDRGDVIGTILFVLGILVGIALVCAVTVHYFSSVKMETIIKLLSYAQTVLMSILALYAVFAINYSWWKFYVRKFWSKGYLIGGAAFVLTLFLISIMITLCIKETKTMLNVEVIDKAASVVETVENKLSESKAVQVAVNAAENAIESATDIPKTEEPKDTEKNVETAAEEVETAVEEETEKPQKVERMGKVRAISGPVEGEAFKLPQKNEIIIGSDPSQSHWIIKDKSVSRKHCSLRYQALENIYIVTDFSTNGTFADGERLEKGVPTPLMSGAELTFARGETKIKLG